MPWRQLPPPPPPRRRRVALVAVAGFAFLWWSLFGDQSGAALRTAYDDYRNATTTTTIHRGR